MRNNEKICKHFAKAALAFALSTALSLFSVSPMYSTSTITLRGTVAGVLALSAGRAANATVSGGTGAGATITPAATNAADGFVTAINFGTLTAGNGTNVVASVPVRVRGNVACHQNAKVSSYTATNIAYGATALTGSGSSTAQLTFITLGTGAITAGARGDLAGVAYQGTFSTGGTLAALSGGSIGPVTSGTSGTNEKTITFPNAPSTNGSLTAGNNWVQTIYTFSCPTGLIWRSTGAGSAFNISVQIALGVGA